ncbi:MAG: hypothetical protein WCA36_00080 [Pseudolabrys sp.]
MIEGFDTRDDLHQLRVVMFDMLDQIVLGIARPCDEYRASVGDRLRDRVQKFLVRADFAAPHRAGLVMEMLGWVIRVQHQLVGLGRIEMEDPRFAMVDPNDGVVMMCAQRPGPFWRQDDISLSAYPFHSSGALI